MLYEAGCSKQEGSGNWISKNCDNSEQPRALEVKEKQRDDSPVQQARGSKFPVEAESNGLLETVTRKPDSSCQGSWKRNRTARKDGGAKRWGNSNFEALQQLANGSSSVLGFSPGALTWARRDNGIWWPAKVLGSEESSLKPKRGNQTLVKFLGLDESDGHSLFSYLDPETVLLFADHKLKFMKQDFTTPDDAKKFELVLVEANEIYAKHMKEALPKELEAAQMKGNSRRKKADLHGRSKRSGQNEELCGAEKKPMKRKREHKELNIENWVGSEEASIEIPGDVVHAYYRSKKRKLAPINGGLDKRTAGKEDCPWSGSTLQKKARGDDGYFFECVVCDLGGNLLCCDNCPCTYHLECLDPPLKRTPPGKWRCPACCENAPAVKIPASFASESRRSSRSRKRTDRDKHTSNVLKEFVKDAQDDESEAAELAPVLPRKRKKGLKKVDCERRDGEDGGTTKVELAPSSCLQCGAHIGDDQTSEDAGLCRQCCKAGSSGMGSPQGKEPEEMALTDVALEVVDMDPLITDEEKRKGGSQPKKDHPIVLEVDRIFGCRHVCKSEPSGSMIDDAVKEKEAQTQGSLVMRVNEIATEESPVSCLPDGKNEQEMPAGYGTEQLELYCTASEMPESALEVGSLVQSEELRTGYTTKSHVVKRENEEKSNAGNGGADSSVPVGDVEFLVKWVGRSHIHDEWVKESELKVLAKRKLDNYRFKYGYTCVNLVEEKWHKPMRIIARRCGQGDVPEVLVKWCGLPYDECTWELECEPVIQSHADLLESFDYFETAALKSDEEEDSCIADKSPIEISTLNEQPSYVKGGSLFPHQIEALNWLRKCWGRKKNVILADEMGLGKTISASAFLCSLYMEFKVSGPCLVLVPLSTMPNWMAEFSVWTPQLNVVEYHGGAKARATIRQFEWHAAKACAHKKDHRSYKFNVLLTTYEMIIADASQLRSIPWEVLIVDEGHRLKNTGSKLVQLLNTFCFSQRVLLTGTPLQNNIGEMHNLLKFLQLDAFPSLAAFEDQFSCLSTAEQVDELKKLVAPHMLRRLKKDAMQNIPPKMERVVPVELSSLQAEYYRALLTRNYQVLRQAGKPNQHQSLVNIVVQLRKVCNHPYLIPGTEPETGSPEFLQEMRIKASAKLNLLHAMLKVLRDQGHRVLIFSQMTRLLDILEDYLTIEFGSYTFERVDGSISVAERQAAIARFNQDMSRFVFLLSTRACGLGINLATADTVIIYDSDFNPHADIQAMNRAHRIGQSKRLLVYRLVVRASVEERILQLAKKKLMLDHLFANKSGSQKEVEDILKWGTEELFQDFSAPEEEALDVPCTENPGEGGLNEADAKQRKRLGGLGDVYEDTCHKASRPKVLWDDAAVARLLDRDDIGTEAADVEGESDMLGSLKAWEWNDQEVNDYHEPNESLPKEKDSGSPSDTNECTVGQGAEDESDWDKILRTRWEKLQVEEEGALGRGKRTRKTVSYKEDFSTAAAEVFNESGNEDGEDAEPEYTPMGRALKNKLARLRARQKERIASRHKEAEGMFGMVPNIFAGSNPSLASLPPSTMSLFQPVRLSEEDLQSLYSNTRFAMSFIDLTHTEAITQALGSTPEGEAADCCMAPEADLSCKLVPSFSVSSSEEDMPVSGPPIKEGRLPPVSPLEGGVHVSPSFAERPRLCHADRQHSGLKILPDLSMSLGLRSSSETSMELVGTSSPMGNLEKLKPSPTPGQVVMNSSIPTTEGSTPKLETDFGSGLRVGDLNVPQKDEKQGKSFPFLSCFEGGGGTAAMSTIEVATSWAEEDLDLLWCGVRRHGRGNWVAMLKDPKLHFSQFKTAKDLAERWNEEQKIFEAPSNRVDPPSKNKEGSILPFNPFQPPLAHKDGFLAMSGPKDRVNLAGLHLPTRDLIFPNMDMDVMYQRGSKAETAKLPGLPPLQGGFDSRNLLATCNTASFFEGAGTARDDGSRLDLGPKLDFLMAGLPNLVFSSKKQEGISVGSSKTTGNSPFHINDNLLDPQTSRLLPRSFASDNECRPSNLHLRFEKGSASLPPMDHLELPKLRGFPNKLPPYLPELPSFKSNLNLPPFDKVHDLKGAGLLKKLKPFSAKGDKDKYIGNPNPRISSDDGAVGKASLSTLPHWLRETFKPTPLDTAVLPSTVAAVSMAIDLVYRDCKPTLPAWASPGPLPIAPHRKAKKRRKRKKGLDLGCRMMGDAQVETREQLGNVLLPPGLNLAVAKPNQFPLLNLGNSVFPEGRLIAQDARHPQTFLHGTSFPSFQWTPTQNSDLCQTVNSHVLPDLPAGSFLSMAGLSLPAPEGLQLPSPFMSFSQFVASDLGLKTPPFSKAMKGTKLEGQANTPQRRPFSGSVSTESFHAAPPQAASRPAGSELPPSDVSIAGQKARSPSAKSEDTRSDSCVKLNVMVSDDASSEQTVSDSKNGED